MHIFNTGHRIQQWTADNNKPQTTIPHKEHCLSRSTQGAISHRFHYHSHAGDLLCKGVSAPVLFILVRVQQRPVGAATRQQRVCAPKRGTRTVLYPVVGFCRHIHVKPAQFLSPYHAMPCTSVLFITDHLTSINIRLSAIHLSTIVRIQ